MLYKEDPKYLYPSGYSRLNRLIQIIRFPIGIKRKHGTNGERRGQLTIESADFAIIPRAINDFGTCKHVDTDKLNYKKFALTKDMGNMVYVASV